MKKAMTNITTWLNDLTDLLKALIVFGIFEPFRKQNILFY